MDGARSREVLSYCPTSGELITPAVEPAVLRRGQPISRASVNGRTVQPRAASFTARQMRDDIEVSDTRAIYSVERTRLFTSTIASDGPQLNFRSRHGSASYSKDLTCVCGWVGTACCSLSHVRGAFKRIHMYQPRQLEAFDAQRKSTTLRLERSLS